MFKFVAVFFLLTNGVPSDKPAGVLTYNQKTFPTEEACAAFPETEAGKAAVGYVNSLVESKKGEISVRLGCQKVEDNTI